MEAIDDVTVQPLRYEQFDWGDLIEGTKAQIQCFGIGLRAAFPGEPGAPKKEIITLDPRGYTVCIRRNKVRFLAYIEFPNWPKDPSDSRRQPVASGVFRDVLSGGDIYEGAADALVAAGIVKQWHFPGPANGRTTSVTWLPDGTLATKCDRTEAPGTIRVRKVSAIRFDVWVNASCEEQQRRSEDFKREYVEYHKLIASIHRPTRLEPLPEWKLRRLAELNIPPYQLRSNVVDLQAWRAGINR